MSEYNQGQRVRWNTPQGETQGEIVERRTSDFQFMNQQFKASKDEPMYIVESEKSGKQAAHREDALSPA